MAMEAINMSNITDKTFLFMEINGGGVSQEVGLQDKF